VRGNQVGGWGEGVGWGWGFVVLSTVKRHGHTSAFVVLPQPLQSVRGWRFFQSCRPSAGPIFISAISLPVAIFSSSMYPVSFACGCADARSRRPVLWPVSSYVATQYPVPPSRSGQYRGYGPACLTFRRRCARRSGVAPRRERFVNGKTDVCKFILLRNSELRILPLP